MGPRGYFDLKRLPEDERIDIIGQAAESGQVVAFIVDTEADANRYMRKLLAKFKVKEITRCSGPVKGAFTVNVGPSRVN
jgi:hypothetical protein